MKTFPLSLLLMMATACGAQAAVTPRAPGANAAPAALSLTSPDFAHGASIPAKYTCRGENHSPALQWSADALPNGVKSLALIVEDPDAPGGMFAHWVLYNLPPDTTGLVEGVSPAGSAESALPQGAQEGPNDFRKTGYGGPCPPSGQHRYFFRLYALDTTISGRGLDRAALLKAMDGHVLGQGELMGVYQK